MERKSTLFSQGGDDDSNNSIVDNTLTPTPTSHAPHNNPVMFHIHAPKPHHSPQEIVEEEEDEEEDNGDKDVDHRNASDEMDHTLSPIHQHRRGSSSSSSSSSSSHLSLPISFMCKAPSPMESVLDSSFAIADPPTTATMTPSTPGTSLRYVVGFVTQQQQQQPSGTTIQPPNGVSNLGTNGSVVTTTTLTNTNTTTTTTTSMRQNDLDVPNDTPDEPECDGDAFSPEPMIPRQRRK